MTKTNEEWSYRVCPAGAREQTSPSQKKFFLMRIRTRAGRMLSRSEFLYKDGWHGAMHTGSLKYMSKDDASIVLSEQVFESLKSEKGTCWIPPR